MKLNSNWKQENRHEIFYYLTAIGERVKSVQFNDFKREEQHIASTWFYDIWWFKIVRNNISHNPVESFYSINYLQKLREDCGDNNEYTETEFSFEEGVEACLNLITTRTFSKYLKCLID